MPVRGDTDTSRRSATDRANGYDRRHAGAEQGHGAAGPCGADTSEQTTVQNRGKQWYDRLKQVINPNNLPMVLIDLATNKYYNLIVGFP